MMDFMWLMRSCLSFSGVILVSDGQPSGLHETGQERFSDVYIQAESSYSHVLK